MAKTQQEIIKECFQAIDKDNSGFIDQAELEQLLRAYNSHPSCPAEFKANFSETEIKKQCKDFIDTVDTSGDQKISLDEFSNYCMK